jgi:arylsulfatase A-like enzyme
MPGMKVLVVTARGLRADYLGCYGNPRVETPALDGLAAAGVVFARHFADAADPAGARRAWRAGRYAFPSAAPLPAGSDLVIALNDAGVTTSLVVDASRPPVEAFATDWQKTEVIPPGGDETPLERTVAAGRSALAALKKNPRWLLWVDLATPLPPWELPGGFAEHYFRDEVVEDEEEDDEAVEVEPLTPLSDPPAGPIDLEDDTLYLRIQGSYSAAVTYLDAGIGELLRGVGDDVVVLVTSDVGYALGEHGHVGPGLAWPAETVTQLPLIIRLPDQTGAGLHVSALTQAVDVPPTLAALFAIAFPDAHGHDLAPLLRGDQTARRPYAVSWLSAAPAIGRSLRTPEWSLILPATTGVEVVPRLYVRPDDHWEVNDLRQHHDELAEALIRTLFAFEESAARPGPLAVPTLPEPESTQPVAG